MKPTAQKELLDQLFKDCDKRSGRLTETQKTWLEICRKAYKTRAGMSARQQEILENIWESATDKG